ncbi:hypothetical protein HZB00_00230, partial [Candidatus Woesearchaeota archaeon]|nr:hypothetical protein [Candidatus Woesearchaeota archaeon]
MEKVRRLMNEAIKAFQTADHLASVTYPLVQEPKLVLPITQNLAVALHAGMSAFLHVDEMRRDIPQVPVTFEERVQLFALRSKRHNIPAHIPELMKQVKNATDYRKQSTF